MEEVFVMTTQLDNETDWVIELGIVDCRRLCPRILPPGENRRVKLSRILKRCRKQGSNWTIPVLINNEVTGIYIKPGDLLYHTRLIFQYKSRVRNGELYDLCMVGIPEMAIDYFLRVEGIGTLFQRNNIWKNRACTGIAVADPRFAIDLRYREIEDPYLVVPLLRDGNSTLEHRTTEAAIRRSPNHDPVVQTDAVHMPVKKERGLSFGIQKARVKKIILQKRFMLYRSRMHVFHHNMKINTHLLFFVLALGLVIGVTSLFSFGGTQMIHI